jgi:hypothetical protein
MSSAVHLLRVETPGGERVPAVLRRYVREDLSAEEPDIAEREARALRFAETIDVATPRLLALDPTGAGAGAPSLLMSLLAGRVHWWPTDLEAWLRGLAELLPMIHAGALPALGVVRPYSPYPQTS